MIAERTPWQPGRAMLGPEVADLAAYMTQRHHRGLTGPGLAGALALSKARGMEQIASVVADTAIEKMLNSADDCTGGAA